jgi:hypothetical protein
VALTEIEERCGFTFPNTLKNADEFGDALQNAPEAVKDRQPVEKLSDINW